MIGLKWLNQQLVFRDISITVKDTMISNNEFNNIYNNIDVINKNE